MAADYFKVITGFQFHRCYEEVYRDCTWVQYFIVHGVDKACCIVFKGARDPKNARAVNKAAWPEVTDLIKSAYAAASRHIEELKEFTEGGKNAGNLCVIRELSPQAGDRRIQDPGRRKGNSAAIPADGGGI